MIENNYRFVIENLKLLAASFDDQKQYLPPFADVADDVISNFENGFLLLPQLIDSNKFSNKSIAAFLRLNNKVQWCLRNTNLDDFSNEEWNNVRDLAKEVLDIIGEPLSAPDPNYI